MAKLSNLKLARQVPDKRQMTEDQKATRAIEVAKGPKNRAIRRAFGDKGRRRLALRAGEKKWPSGPHARHSGPTGQPQHFLNWLAETKVRKHLQSLKISTLASKIQDAAIAKSFTLLAPHFANVWDLAAARREDLLALPGVGRVTLQRVHKYLSSFNVQMEWAL